MSQGYSSGGNQKGSTPLNSQIYAHDNFQGSFANFIQKEMKSYLSDKEASTDNIIAAFNNVIENIKNTYKQANNLKGNETSPALEKLIIELNSIPSSLKAMYKDNVAQFQNQGTLGISEVISRNPDVAASLKDIKGAKDSNGVENKLDERGANNLAKLKGSPIEKLLVHAKTQADTLGRIEKILYGVAVTTNAKIPGLMVDINNEDDNEANARQAEQEDWFAGLGSTISRTIFNHPGVNKMGIALGQLGNLALIKGVLSNRKLAEDHPVLHKAAALAVYFQIPQLAVNLIGAIFQQVVTNWLVNSIGPKIGQGLTNLFISSKLNFANIFSNLGPKLGNILNATRGFFVQLVPKLGGIFNVLRAGLSNVLSGAGRMLLQLGARLIPLLGPIAIAAAIIAGIALTIKGIMNHHKNMKENDARIDNDSSMTQSEKDKAKLGAHFKSGVKETALPGALAGAGIGAAIGSIIPGVGTVVGAIVGGLIGLIAGPIISVIKPLTQMFQHAWPDIKSNTVNALKGVGNFLKALYTPIFNLFKWFIGVNVKAFKWLFNHSDKIISFIKPIMKFIGEIVMMLNPIFLIFKAIKAVVDWVRNKFGIGKDDKGKGGKDDNSNPGPINDTSGTNPVATEIKNVLLHPIEAAKAAKVVKQNGIDAVSMRSLGLYGSIASINSIPYIARGNAEGLRQLDGILKGWGYDTVYTSAMGGHSKGGHVKGNKVDFQLLQNGKTAHLSQEQLNYLQSLGYWGGKTGALGWEKVNGQVGGGHYDINTSNVKITEPYVKAFEEEKKRTKEKEEKNKDKDKDNKDSEKSKKENNKVAWSPSAAGSINNGQNDITGSGAAIGSFTNDRIKIGEVV